MSGKWITSWGMACCSGRLACANVGKRTTRAVITSGMNGSKLRLRLSNRYGAKSLLLGRVIVETGGQKAQIFLNGKETIYLDAGKEVCTDVLEIPVTAGEPITVSTYYPHRTIPISGNATFTQTHSVPGDYTLGDFVPQAFQSAATRYFHLPIPEPLATLATIDVYTEDENAFTVIALGDSLTQMGYWVNPLREKLHYACPGSATLLNMGISGNRLLLGTGVRLLKGIFGQAGLERIHWDVFSLEAIKVVLLDLGGNDIAQPGMGRMSPHIKEMCSADGLIEGYKKVIAACHERGIKVVGCTITPFGGMVTSNKTTEAIRQTTNCWILESGAFDASLDFASVVADPADQTRLLPDYDLGDHLHLNMKGGRSLAEFVDLADLVAHL